MMKLTLEQRFALIKILPEKGDITLMINVRKLQELLVPSDKEEAEFVLGQSGDTTRWNKTFYHKFETAIEIGQIMAGRIREELERLSKKGELLSQHVSLYEKFVTTEKPAEDAEETGK